MFQTMVRIGGGGMSELFNLQLPLWFCIVIWYIGYVIGMAVEKGYRR